MHLQRLVHLAVILAILPGVLLPGQTTLCLCAALSCGSCPVRGHGDGVETPRRACCKKHETSCVVVAEKSSCQCCVVLTPHKQTTPKPEKAGIDAQLLAAPFALAPVTIPATPTWCQPLPAARSHAPPDANRLLPLLI